MTSANINESKRDVSIGVSQSNTTEPKYTVYMKLNSSDAINVTNNTVTVNGNLTANDVQTNNASLNYQSSELSTLTTNISTLERTVASLQKEVDDLKNISRVDISYSHESGDGVFTLNYNHNNNELYFFDYPSYKIDGVQYGVISAFIKFSSPGLDSDYYVIGSICFNPQNGSGIDDSMYEINNGQLIKRSGYHGVSYSVSYDASQGKIYVDPDTSFLTSSVIFAESVNIFQRPKST